MVPIRQNLVPEWNYENKCPYGMDPLYIAVHNTANDAPAANEVNYMINNPNEASFHYAVDDKEIVQGVPEDRNTWNAGDGDGDGNMRSISVEICYSLSGGERFTQAEKNAAEFIASILKRNGWGINRVKKHQDFNGKYCPHRTLDMGWQRFLNMVREFLGQEAKPIEPTKPVRPLQDLGPVDCIYQVFTDRWWPPVKNREDWAGAGDGEAIRYLGICVSKGTISGRVYTERSAWLPYLTFGSGYNINDTENGVLGDGSPIQAIELYYHTPDGYLYKKAVYCASDMNHEIFYPAQYDNETGNGQDGYAGVKGVAVDKFQAWIE